MFIKTHQWLKLMESHKKTQQVCELETEKLGKMVTENDTEIAHLRAELAEANAKNKRLEKLLKSKETPVQDTETELRNRLEQQSIIAKLGEKGLLSDDLSSFMTEIVQIIGQTLNVKLVKILELLSNESSLLLKAGIGWQTGLIGFAKVSAGIKSHAGYTLASKHPVIVKDLRIETRFSGTTLLHNHRVVSGINVIIPGKNKPYGILGIHSTKERNFTENDVNFLQAVSHILAAAIEGNKQKEELHLFKRALDASSNGIVITDALESDHPTVYINPAFEKITGYSKEEILGTNCRFLQEKDKNQQTLKDLREALQTGQEYRGIVRNYRKNGSLFWNELHIAPVQNSENHLTHFIGIQTDISERKKLEEERDRFFTISLDLLCIADFKGYFKRLNPAFQKTLGYTDQELMSRPFICFIHPDDRQKTLSEFNKLKEGNVTLYLENRFLTKKGTYHWLSWTAAPFTQEQSIYAVAHDITEQKRASEALKQTSEALLESQERLNSILTSLDDIVWSATVDTLQLLYINSAAEKIYGRSMTEFYQKTTLWSEIVHPDDRTLVQVGEQKLRETGLSDLEYRILRPDGEIRWVRSRCRLIYDYHQHPLRMDGIVTDITAKKQAEQALKQSETLFRLIFELAPIGMAITDLQGNFEQVNESLCENLDYTETQLKQLSFVDVTHQDDISEDLALHHKLISGEISEFKTEKRYLAKNGAVRYGILQVVALLDQNKKTSRLLRQLVDITDRKQIEEKLLHDALHDSLTGLPNRQLFLDRLDQAIKRQKRHQEYLFAVLFLDLDRFKVINDSAGHIIGDKLLVAIARQLEDCLRPTDTVARLGGDEFTILLDDLQSIEYATNIAERIHQQFKHPLKIEGQELLISVSIGITIGREDYQQPEELLRDADIAMYQAKESGRSRHELFNKIMHRNILEKLQLEKDLWKAIEKREFILHYQPIICLKTGKIKGFEALIRWIHPEHGFVSPVKFIPIAEETGLIVPIGELVLKTACQQMQTWQNLFPHLRHLTMSVNLSGRQLRVVNLLERITAIVSETKINPENLKLEITESMLMENVEEVIKILNQIKTCGIKLAIDDFGTGYSSLSYLQRFPVDTLKVDRSFVKDMGEKGENSEIIKAIISLAHSLGMSVTAEGIETPTQLEQIKALHCEEAQGYLFYKPLEAKSIEKLLTEMKL